MANFPVDTQSAINANAMLADFNMNSAPVLADTVQKSLPQLMDITKSSIPLLQELTIATLPQMEAYTAALKKYNAEGGAFPQPPKELEPFGLSGVKENIQNQMKQQRNYY